MIDIDAIKARCEAATPGPWTYTECEWECDCANEEQGECSYSLNMYDEDSEINPAACGQGSIERGAYINETSVFHTTTMEDRDADFIAQARTDIPALIEDRERLWRALQKSVELQSHYAYLLNMHDGGERMQFDSADAWIQRVEEAEPRLRMGKAGGDEGEGEWLMGIAYGGEKKG